MSIFESLGAFWAEIVTMLTSIIHVINNTTTALETLSEEDINNNIIMQYMGYVINVTGRPLWMMLVTFLQIGIGITVYTTFLKGVVLIKELLIRLKK